MKQLLVFITILFLLACHQKKKDEFSLQLIPVKQGDYWGYIDKTGKFVVNPQFKKAYTFSEDVALVENTEGKYGYIDMSGKLIISPVYKTALCFSEGLAAVVKENEKITYIDNTGKTILTLDANIETAEDFSDGLALVEANGKKSFIDKTGKIVFDCPFENIYSFHDGFAAISMKSKEDNKYGFIDKNGKIAINPQFDIVSPFFENRALIKIDKKYGFIDNTGKIVVTPQFDDASLFSQGLVGVRQGDLWGFVDNMGKFVINPQYKYVSIFTSSGLCAVKPVNNEKWGFINKEGKIVIEPQFESVSDFYDGVSVINLNNKFGVIDKAGKYMSNPMYEDYELKPMGYTYRVETDFFDINGISGLLFNDINLSSARGVAKTTSFITMQAKYPGLTHDNFVLFKDFQKEENIAMELTSISFSFGNTFKKVETRYKTEQQYNPTTQTYDNVTVTDGDNITYDDNATVKEITYTYRLKNKAATKATEIIKSLKDKLPSGFTLDTPDSATIVLSGLDYGIVIHEEDAKLLLLISFEKEIIDYFKKSKLTSDSTNFPF